MALDTASTLSVNPLTWTNDEDVLDEDVLRESTAAELSASKTQEAFSSAFLFTNWSSFISSLDPYKKIQWGLAWNGASPYESEGETLKAPASTLKIFTASAALKYLGGDFKFQNYFRGTLVSDENGSTLIQPEFEVSGDPTWGSAQYDETLFTRIDQVIEKLIQYKVKKISGPIQIVTSQEWLLRFKRPTEWKASWDTQCYAALLSPVILSYNCAALKVVSATSAQWSTIGVGTPIVFESKALQNPVKRVPTPKFDALGRVEQYELTSGHAAVGTYAVPVQNNEDWLRSLFILRLKNFGISYSEHEPAFKKFEWAAGNLSSVEVELHSKPLVEILPPFLQLSINIIGERLALEVASKKHLPAIGDAGVLILSEIARESGNTKFYDGSGLIPNNAVAPKLMYQFLSNLRYESYFKDFLSALPVSGKSGTLKTRLTGPTTLGRVVAKTGTIDGVANLAGYFLSKGYRVNSLASWPKINPEFYEPFVSLTYSKTAPASTVRKNTDSIIVKLVGDNNQKRR